MSKKLIIAFSALALAILAGAIAVVGVFAAQQQKVANTFTISYKADNVAVWLNVLGFQGASTIGFSNPLDNVDNSKDNFITPDMEEDTFEYSASIDEITLSAQHPWFLINMIIENTLSIGSTKKIQVTLTDTTTDKENVEVYYYIGTDGSVMSDNVSAEKLGSTTIPDPVVMPTPCNTHYVAVLVKVKDVTLDAHYISTATNGLGVTLNAVD